MLYTNPVPKRPLTQAEIQKYLTESKARVKKIEDINKAKYPTYDAYLKAQIEKKANGGTIRPSSRNRHIAPLAIQAGVQILGSVMSMMGAANAQKQQKKDLAAQAYAGLNNQYLEQKRNDAHLYNETDLYGNNNVSYYATGGEISDQNSLQNMSPDQQAMIMQSLTQMGGKTPQLPVSNGGYQTQGGNLVPIGAGVEKVVGNKHNDTKIDGVSGVQLSQNGETVAEVEDQEVIVDGDKVLSNRLKFDKNKTYAKKMEEITKKRNKLEKEQEGTTNKRKMNTIDRKLASLNMAEEALFTVQELHKMKEGGDTLKNLDTFANGGKIRKFEGGGQFPKQQRIKTINNRYQIPGVIPYPFYTGNYGGAPMVKYENNAMNQAVGNNSPSTSTNTSYLMGQTPLASTAIPNLSSTYTVPSSLQKEAGTKGLASEWGDSAVRLGGLVMDNIGNYILTKNTPKLPTPLMNRAENLETRVNINPQLAEIRSNTRATNQNILNNTSNSNNAKNNIIANSLNANKQTNELLGNKENQELQLRNANAQNKQMVNMQNTATMNQYAMNQYQRANDIRTQLSGNLTNLQGDIKTVFQMKDAKDNFEGYQLANLADDKLGEKAALYLTNKSFMAVPAQRTAILAKLEEKDADGNYRYPYDRDLAIKLGYITE